MMLSTPHPEAKNEAIFAPASSDLMFSLGLSAVTRRLRAASPQKMKEPPGGGSSIPAVGRGFT